MNTDNREFFDLLSSVATEQTFSLTLTDGSQVNCKQLTTSQLKELVKTVVDSPLTQAAFNTTATEIFNQSLVEGVNTELNTVDRTLFILETRIQSLSPTVTLKKEEKSITVDLRNIKEKLSKEIESHKDLFESKSLTEGQITLSFGVPTLKTELQLNREVYKNFKTNVENVDELRKALGEAFINEIAKSINSLSIGEQILDFNTVSFKQRLKAVETLPASIVQKVIEYIENYKKIVEDCFIIDGETVPLDGTLFSLR